MFQNMTTADIQHLREQTGVGMMQAKRALEASQGDMALAIEHLRKSGQKIAASKSERSAREGVIGTWISTDQRQVALVVLTCETDFVARTEDFQQVANRLAAHLGTRTGPELTAESFLTQDGLDGQSTVNEFLATVIARLGENMQIPKIAAWSSDKGMCSVYVHANKKIASIVEIESASADVGHEVALHVAAMNPTYLDAASVPPNTVASEQEIYREQLRGEGKPEAMWDKIIPGKLKKFYADVCLLDQAFVKDDTVTVAKYLQQNGPGQVRRFVRLTL